MYRKFILAFILLFGFATTPSVQAIEPVTIAVGASCFVSGVLGLERVYILLTEYYKNASYREIRNLAKKLIDQGEQKNFFACCVLSEAEYNNWCDDHDQEVRQVSFVMSEDEFIVACKREFAQNINPLLRAHEVLKKYWIECAALNDALASKSAFYESKGLPVGELQTRLNKIINRIRRNMVIIENVLGIGAEAFKEKEEMPKVRKTQEDRFELEVNRHDANDQEATNQEAEEEVNKSLV